MHKKKADLLDGYLQLADLIASKHEADLKAKQR
jgi:hypothetical protein